MDPHDDFDRFDDEDESAAEITDHADMADDGDRPAATVTVVEPSAAIILDPLQQQAIDHARDHLFTDIRGSAGVGKTLVAREIVRCVPGTVLTATTGIAATNLGEGTTIHSLLKFFNTQSLIDSYREGHLQAVIRKLRRAGVQRILIDEKSMLSGQRLTPIARAVREVNEGGIYALETIGVGENEDDPNPLPIRDSDLPHIGITLCGDFAQLSPVPDEDPITGKKIPIQFAFESPEWPIFAEHTTSLQTIYRQGAEDFVAALHAVRTGRIVDALKFFTADRFSATQDDSFEGSTIFAKNDAVDRHNMLMLDKLPGAPMVNRAIRRGKQRPDWKNIPDELRLKEQALVMILANRREYEDDDDERGRMIYANGDLGTLLGTKGNGWLVQLQRTNLPVAVYPIRRENTIPLEPGRRKEMREQFLAGRGADPAEIITEKGKGKSEIIGTVDYLPLRAAWGTTTHKSQGITVDRLQVSIRDPFFRHPSMLYVALSRCRTIEGLRLVGDQRGFAERVRIEPRTLPWL